MIFVGSCTIGKPQVDGDCSISRISKVPWSSCLQMQHRNPKPFSVFFLHFYEQRWVFVTQYSFFKHNTKTHTSNSRKFTKCNIHSSFWTDEARTNYIIYLPLDIYTSGDIFTKLDVHWEVRIKLCVRSHVDKDIGLFYKPNIHAFPRQMYVAHKWEKRWQYSHSQVWNRLMLQMSWFHSPWERVGQREQDRQTHSTRFQLWYLE